MKDINRIRGLHRGSHVVVVTSDDLYYSMYLKEVELAARKTLQNSWKLTAPNLLTLLLRKSRLKKIKIAWHREAILFCVIFRHFQSDSTDSQHWQTDFDEIF